MGKKIRELMTAHLVQVEADKPVTEAARKMREENVGDVLVMRAGRLAGLLTDRDIVVRCVATESDPASTPVHAVCSTEMATLSPDDDSDDAIRLMSRKAIRRIPVVEDGTVCGIVSIGDLAEHHDPDSALGRISGSSPNR